MAGTPVVRRHRQTNRKHNQQPNIIPKSLQELINGAATPLAVFSSPVIHLEKTNKKSKHDGTSCADPATEADRGRKKEIKNKNNKISVGKTGR